MPSPQRPSDSYQDRHAYIPPQVEQAMTKQMEHALPAHMKKYAGAYVQQHMTGAGMSAPGRMTGPPPGYKPVTHLPRKDHFHQYKAQTPSRADTFSQSPQTIQPDLQQAPVQPQAPAYPPDPSAATYQPQPQSAPQQAYGPQPQQPQEPQTGIQSGYDFIMNPQQPGGRNFLNGSSLAVRIGIAAAGLVILLILFNVIKGLIAGPSVVPDYVSVVQDQQSIVHLASGTFSEKNADITQTNANFSATAQLSVGSSQATLIGLLAKSGHKVKPKEMLLKVSASNDQRLAQAVASGTYNETYKEIMQQQLQAYMNDLKTAYDKSKGAKGRAALSDQYRQAELLLEQLNSP